MFAIIKMNKLVILLVWFCHVDIESGQLTAESKSTHCSYTFNVPRDEHNGFCSSDNNTSDDGGPTKSQMFALISNQQEQLKLLTATLLEMKESQREMKETQVEMKESQVEMKESQVEMKETQVEIVERLDQIDSDPDTQSSTTKIGANYIRWGRTVCPDTAVKLYDGYVAKSRAGYTGGGVDHICLHSDPELPQGSASASGLPYSSKITGVEYQHIFQHEALIQSDAPCAACIVHGRSQQMMIPGRLTCDDGWTKEYSGVLASAHHNHKKASYVCLDADPETVPGSAASAGLFYSVEIECAYAAFCPPYVDGNVLFCVVCTM